jgi:hypothetical protein
MNDTAQIAIAALAAGFGFGLLIPLAAILAHRTRQALRHAAEMRKWRKQYRANFLLR